MGKQGAFLEYGRETPGYRPKEERIQDFVAVEKQLDHKALNRQAARCMDCGTPFCHAYGCPLSNIIPEFNDFVYRGSWRAALDILLSTNNFPEFTGRVCPAPCEAACVAGINNEPVTIRQIELAIIEKGFESGYVSKGPPPVRLDQSIAVIGSGPAGLAAADTLNRAGYRVTVYDSANRPGGILRNGIPDFKLEKWVVERRIRLMEEEGIGFEMDVNVGEDVSYDYLKRRFDAVCLACGATEPRDLKVPGRELEGIYFAMDYLTQQNMKNRGEFVPQSREISARGKTVILIGGGDTGSDCLGTALRQGAEKVLQLEIMPKPPVERPIETPWPLWPRVLRETHAHEEGGEVRWGVTTLEFFGKDGKVSGIRCAEVEWKKVDNEGLKPIKIPGTEFTAEADIVLLAMGFNGPEQNKIIQDQGLLLDSRGNVLSGDNGMTNREGLFVAGDMHMGQSLVVRAISDGRRAARGIKSYLSRGAKPNP